jgi:hypothetical protein
MSYLQKECCFSKFKINHLLLFPTGFPRDVALQTSVIQAIASAISASKQSRQEFYIKATIDQSGNFHMRSIGKVTQKDTILSAFQSMEPQFL